MERHQQLYLTSAFFLSVITASLALTKCQTSIYIVALLRDICVGEYFVEPFVASQVFWSFLIPSVQPSSLPIVHYIGGDY